LYNTAAQYIGLSYRDTENSLVHNMYIGPINAQYEGTVCCYAGIVHGTGGTVLGKL